MPDGRAESFLEMIRRSRRGRLKVYLGFAPGVGKTYQMLVEGHRLKGEGVDVVIGVVEHHGREATRKLIDGLERVPMRSSEYHGIRVEEMDLAAVLARKPQVCLVDELAHTNVPGSTNDKRFKDVQDLLAAGIHVITALNVQHLESLYDTVERLVGVKVRERLPDAVLVDADEVVNVDLAAEDLQKRVRDGRIYPKDRIASSLENFFTSSNLQHLRELTLRELAAQIDAKRRGDASISLADEGGAGDQVMVCLSSRGPSSARLLRYGSRLAGRMNRNWYAVYVQTPNEDPAVIDAATQQLLADTLTLANQLGATVFTFKGQDIPDTLLRFASEYRCGNIVIGSPHPMPWWRRLLGQRSVAEQLILRQRNVTVIVVDADVKDPEERPIQLAPVASRASSQIHSFVTPRRVLIYPDPVTKEQVIRDLISVLALGVPGHDSADLLHRIREREERGSTFLNEGVALPHARVKGLDQAVAAMALTRSGVLDASTDRPVEIVFLLLSPEGGSGHLAALAQIGRLLGDRSIRAKLATAKDEHEAMDRLT